MGNRQSCYKMYVFVHFTALDLLFAKKTPFIVQKPYFFQLALLIGFELMAVNRPQ